MPFEREWDSSCPHVWDRWEADGSSWVIQDLPPEDDEEALQIMVEHLIPDEVLCIASGMTKDPASMQGCADFWKGCLAQRMSLACYAETGGSRNLAALNCCIVTCAGEKDDSKIEGEAWNNVYNAVKYTDDKVDSFKYLGVDKLLSAMGLVVRRQYRGAKLGSKLLAAREPLSLSLGIKGTATVFTGVPSQKSAERAGFVTAAAATMRELAAAGLRYPADDRLVKLMVKSYPSKGCASVESGIQTL